MGPGRGTLLDEFETVAAVIPEDHQTEQLAVDVLEGHGGRVAADAGIGAVQPGGEPDGVEVIHVRVRIVVGVWRTHPRFAGARPAAHQRDGVLGAGADEAA